jgi:hypothetical protein
VVVFPFVPVTAITFPSSCSQANSISGTIRRPSISGARSTAALGGMPGLSTMRSASASLARSCPPTSASPPSARISSAALRRSGRSPASLT